MFSILKCADYAGPRRTGSDFHQARRVFAGMLYVFQENTTKPVKNMLVHIRLGSGRALRDIKQALRDTEGSADTKKFVLTIDK